MDQKEKILQHASQKFLTVGIRNVTMDSLATELSVSKRTIYELFGDKDKLVIESLRFMILENNKEFLKIIEVADNVVEAIFLITKRQDEMRKQFPVVFMEDIKRYFPLVQASFYSCKSNLKQFSATFTMLEKGVKEGIFRKDLQIELVDNFIHEIISLIHTSERIRVLNPGDKDVFNNIFLPYLRGICTNKGLNLIDKFFEEESNNN
jgi:AcrR family transcriptional regulator